MGYCIIGHNLFLHDDSQYHRIYRNSKCQNVNYICVMLFDIRNYVDRSMEYQTQAERSERDFTHPGISILFGFDHHDIATCFFMIKRVSW